MKPVDPLEAAEFCRRRADSPVEFLVVHAMYLLNLASPDPALRSRSISALREERIRAERLGADAIVVHLGAHRGAGVAAGIDRIIEGLDRVGPPEGATRLLLENTAGAGTTLGASFEEIGAILEGTRTGESIGVCLDTAHAHAAGYPLGTRAGLRETLGALDRWVGIERLGLIHLNDSAAPAGSRRDRHAHIGDGEIGSRGISRILSDRRLRDRPYILETPKEIDGRPDADRVNLARVRRLRTEGEGR